MDSGADERQGLAADQAQGSFRAQRSGYSQPSQFGAVGLHRRGAEESEGSRALGRRAVGSHRPGGEAPRQARADAGGLGRWSVQRSGIPLRAQARRVPLPRLPPRRPSAAAHASRLGSKRAVPRDYGRLAGAGARQLDSRWRDRGPRQHWQAVVQRLAEPGPIEDRMGDRDRAQEHAVRSLRLRPAARLRDEPTGSRLCVPQALSESERHTLHAPAGGPRHRRGRRGVLCSRAGSRLRRHHGEKTRQPLRGRGALAPVAQGEVDPERRVSRVRLHRREGTSREDFRSAAARLSRQGGKAPAGRTRGKRLRRGIAGGPGGSIQGPGNQASSVCEEPRGRGPGRVAQAGTGGPDQIRRMDQGRVVAGPGVRAAQGRHSTGRSLAARGGSRRREADVHAGAAGRRSNFADARSASRATART